MGVVEDYYDKFCNEEEVRLKKDSYHTLEFIVTKYYLKKYLPKKGCVLDLGCGPGDYSISLAKEGYNITLVDISKKLLNISIEKMKQAHLKTKLKDAIHTSAVDLSMLKDNTFDAVICFGPMYHTIKISDRIKIIKEIKRVAKPGAKLFISCISIYGVYGRILQKYPEDLNTKSHTDLFNLKMIHRMKWHSKEKQLYQQFPDAKFDKPEEFQKFVKKLGLETIDIFACEGISTHLREETNEIYQNKKLWKKWVELLIKNSNEKSIVGLTEHFVLVGKNKK